MSSHLNIAHDACMLRGSDLILHIYSLWQGLHVGIKNVNDVALILTFDLHLKNLR